MKIGYQLKQVRERLAKGLVDKGILRTEKRNFLLFDMATHPVTDNTAKDEIRRRVRAVLTNRTVVLPPTPWLPEEMDYRYLRTIAMLCAAYAANVLENALSSLGHEARERAFAQVDEMLAEYSQWPFGRRAGGQAAMGANLDAVIKEEIGGSPERELQMEVCCVSDVPEERNNADLNPLLRLLRHAWAFSPVWIPSSRCHPLFQMRLGTGKYLPDVIVSRLLAGNALVRSAAPRRCAPSGEHGLRVSRSKVEVKVGLSFSTGIHVCTAEVWTCKMEAQALVPGTRSVRTMLEKYQGKANQDKAGRVREERT